MKFFTDITTNASNFCLLNIKKYYDPRKESKKIVFVDPGVYELKKHREYSQIELLQQLAQGELKENEYLSIDYPCDMNLQYADEFIAKSIENNLRYAENPQYICTIQFRFQDFDSFRENWEHLECWVNFPQKIIGIGNLCRIMYPNEFTNDVFEYIISHTSKGQQIHFYGLSLRLIKTYIPLLERAGLVITLDSTKWTKAVTNTLKLAHGVCCRKATRDLYFFSYMDEIRPYCEIQY